MEDQLKATYGKSAVEYESKAAVKKLNKKYFVWYDIRTSNWYRVEIIDYLNDQNSNYVRVFAFDFGFKDKTSVSYLRTLNVQFFKLKKFAIRCYMKNVSFFLRFHLHQSLITVLLVIILVDISTFDEKYRKV